ncbi:MAG: hypothetical protein Q9190_004430 [Brigantiaea leucoxantha]
MGILVAGVRTTRENGATLFVPGSHLWDHSRQPRPEEVVPAELEVGEAFLFLGSAVHAGGANKTSQPRVVHGFFFCRSYLRPEEDQHMMFSKEEVQSWSAAAQMQAGYILGNPYLGHSNETNVMEQIQIDNRKSSG